MLDCLFTYNVNVHAENVALFHDFDNLAMDFLRGKDVRLSITKEFVSNKIRQLDRHRPKAQQIRDNWQVMDSKANSETHG
jgi:hypothetical protein